MGLANTEFIPSSMLHVRHAGWQTLSVHSDFDTVSDIFYEYRVYLMLVQSKQLPVSLAQVLQRFGHFSHFPRVLTKKPVWHCTHLPTVLKGTALSPEMSQFTHASSHMFVMS